MLEGGGAGRGAEDPAETKRTPPKAWASSLA